MLRFYRPLFICQVLIEIKVMQAHHRTLELDMRTGNHYGEVQVTAALSPILYLRSSDA